MATNKHATIRYQALDRCFKNSGRHYNMDALVKACNQALKDYTGSTEGVKRRQVYDDIAYMESSQGWSIPLQRVRDGHKVYFRYSDRNFSINSRPLNQSEANQLKEALLTLSRFKGMPTFEWVDELSARLDSGMGLTKSAAPIIEFDQNKNLKGLEHITAAYNAILNSKTLKIEYKSFKQETSETFHFYPYFLKQFNNRWFLFGRREGIDHIINLALDRIEFIEMSNKHYVPNKSIDFNKYFKDIIGVSIDSKETMQILVLKFSISRFPYIVTKPIHTSQEILEKTDDYGIISLQLIPNNELDALIHSYGDDVEVISPLDYRNKIKDKLEKTLAKYQE